jgi:hypothetical protein
MCGGQPDANCLRRGFHHQTCRPSPRDSSGERVAEGRVRGRATGHKRATAGAGGETPPADEDVRDTAGEDACATKPRVFTLDAL